MTELGINSGFYTKDLLNRAKEIIFRHRELQAKALKLQSKVSQFYRFSSSFSNFEYFLFASDGMKKIIVTRFRSF